MVGEAPAHNEATGRNLYALLIGGRRAAAESAHRPEAMSEAETRAVSAGARRAAGLVGGVAAMAFVQWTSAVRIWLGVSPVQRLNACVNALTSLKPSSHAILDICSLRSSR